ncbi:MAG: hypothetical protein AAF939_14845 [Planctomycetota bacterium]
MENTNSVIFKTCHWIVFAIIVTSSCSGCYQREIAPEVNYDQAEVEKLETEIEKLDWEF